MMDGIVICRCMKAPQHIWYWYINVTRIRSIYPSLPIIIIDDYSKEEYRLLCKPVEVSVSKLNVINSELPPGRGELLPFYYLHKYKYFDNALIIHDSMFIHHRIDNVKLQYPGFQFLWHFDSSFRHEEPTQYLIDNMGLSKDVYHDINALYTCGDKWVGCFGTAMIITQSALDMLENRFKAFSRLAELVDTRDKRSGLERVIPFMLMMICGKQSGDDYRGLYGNIMSNHPMSFRLSFDMYCENKKNLEQLPVVKVWSKR